MLGSFGSDAGVARDAKTKPTCDLEAASVALGIIPKQSLGSPRTILSNINIIYRLPILVQF